MLKVKQKMINFNEFLYKSFIINKQQLINKKWITDLKI